ncbi:MAG: DNA primase, partial [Chloroflexaceae bacterium]|nr:DNA primase [Chloroflexaceae bacterium]
MNTIDEIKSRVNIVDIVSEVVELRKSGRALQGFCPFHHNVNTPAFTVYPDTQSFYCFGCHAAGTVFDFVMRQRGLEFRETMELLAAHAGIELKPRTVEDEAQDRQRTRMQELNALAARYFNYVLVQHARGQPGRDYLAGRDLTEQTIEAFQLGYALNERGHLLHYLTERKGYAIDEVVAAGLVIYHEERGYYDRFRGRLMFPIRNQKGAVVGFGGRALGDAQPKYMNTPQTLLFDKSQTLYGLDMARDHIRQSDACVVVEGYVDVLTAHQHGFRNVVAPLGTALTSGHVGLIKKLSQHVYLALDADAAGRSATMKGLRALQDTSDADDTRLHAVVTGQGAVHWANDINLRIIQLPDGNDPDDVIKKDAAHWRRLIDEALPVVDFYISAYTADLDLSNAQHQRTALDRLLPVLAQLEGTQQRVYIARLEHVIGIRAEVILDLLREQRS